MSTPFRYEFHNEEIERKLNEIGHKLKEGLPEGYGFMLMIFGYSNEEMFYMSSAQRETMIHAMQEFIAKFREN
jgi:hypothetical protein